MGAPHPDFQKSDEKLFS